MDLSKPASSPRAAAPHPAGAGCRTAAPRVQMMELSKPASSPRAVAPHPAGAGCRTAARRVQMMELSKPGHKDKGRASYNQYSSAIDRRSDSLQEDDFSGLPDLESDDDEQGSENVVPRFEVQDDSVMA